MPSPTAAEPFFLSSGAIRPLCTLAYDFFSFVLFLIFLVICWIVGGLFHILDNMFRTRLIDRLIRFFEFFGR